MLSEGRSHFCQGESKDLLGRATREKVRRIISEKKLMVKEIEWEGLGSFTRKTLPAHLGNLPSRGRKKGHREGDQ